MQILVVAYRSMNTYHLVMELVGKDLIAMEKARKLENDSIRENLRSYFSKDIEAKTGRPPSPEAVKVEVEKVWHSWRQWRLGNIQPRVRSQKHQAAGLGFSSLAECESFLEKFRQGKPLPLKGTAISMAEESREAVGDVTPGYDTPRPVRSFLLELFGTRLEILPLVARDFIARLWHEIQEETEGIDGKVAELEKFLKIFSSAGTAVSESRSGASNTNAEEVSPKKRRSKSQKTDI